MIGNFGQSAALNHQQLNNQANYHLEPTPEFKEFFLNPSLVQLLFNCYELVRDDSDMSHALMQSIIQLSTLSGPIFKDEDSELAIHNQISNNRVEFLNNYFQHFLTVFTKYSLFEFIYLFFFAYIKKKLELIVFFA